VTTLTLQYFQTGFVVCSREWKWRSLSALSRSKLTLVYRHQWYWRPPGPSRTSHGTVFLRNVLKEKSSLHYLLPIVSDLNTVNRLRHAKTFELSQTW